jgi:hypothetical protein
MTEENNDRLNITRLLEQNTLLLIKGIQAGMAHNKEDTINSLEGVYNNLVAIEELLENTNQEDIKRIVDIEYVKKKKKLTLKHLEKLKGINHD